MHDPNSHDAAASNPRSDGTAGVKELLCHLHDELRQLLQQRAEITRRTGVLKKTISGISNLFGDNVLGEDLRALMVGQADHRRKRGLTSTCRMVVMQADRAISAREVYEQIHKETPSLLVGNKYPLAAITTILNRLVDYGEVQRTHLANGSGWQWIAEEADSDSSAAGK